MTIAERFAKFTTEELREACVRLEEKITEAKKAVDHFAAEGNVEFFKMARKEYDETVTMYFDIKCAYDARR